MLRFLQTRDSTGQISAHLEIEGDLDSEGYQDSEISLEAYYGLEPGQSLWERYGGDCPVKVLSRGPAGNMSSRWAEGHDVQSWRHARTEETTLRGLCRVARCATNAWRTGDWRPTGFHLSWLAPLVLLPPVGTSHRIKKYLGIGSPPEREDLEKIAAQLGAEPVISRHVPFVGK